MRFLYHLYAGDGSLLYVGCTTNLRKRLVAHARKPWWPEVVELHSEPSPDAWIREQNEIRTAPGRHNVTQLENARRGWETRRRIQQACHAAGCQCQVANCRVCRRRDRVGAAS